LSTPDEAYPGEVREELCAELFGRTKIVIVSLVPALIIMRLILGDAFLTHPPLRWTMGAALASVFLRFVTVYGAKHLRVPPGVQARERAFILSTLALGLSLASIIVAGRSVLSDLQIALFVVWNAGVCSVGLISLAPSFAAYLTLLLPSLGVLALVIVTRAEPNLLHGTLDVMIVPYMAVMAAMARRLNKALRVSTLMRLRLRDLANRDTLTGLFNRRFIGEFMETETIFVQRSWREPGRDTAGRSLGLILLDLDFFKAINDTHGHDAGDAVLRTLSRTLQETARASDIVARWGGEEFVVVLREVDRDKIGVAAERFRQAVADTRLELPSGEVIRATCSIGHAAFPLSAEHAETASWEQSLASADAALYMAKQQGRNRSISAAGVEVTSERPTTARSIATT
jgi:diguanylate cyclase (GGDEF)-like protein